MRAKTMTMGWVAALVTGIGAGGIGAQMPAGKLEALALERARMATMAAPLAEERAVLAARRAELASLGALRASRPRRSFATVPPAAWLQEDPGNTLYQTAREALNRGRYQDAASRFASLRERFPRSGYVADSYYWQAFALFRQGDRGGLREARTLLREQKERFPEAGTRSDADELVVRIEAQLARGGDARAAAVIAQEASAPCGQDQEVRLTALSALMNMNAEQALPILQEVLRSRDECSVELRRRAVFLVAQKMTDESVDILLDLAQRNPDPDPEVREQAVFWLHQVHTPEALRALESILTESQDPDLQEKALFAISQRGDDTASVHVLQSYAERGDAPHDLREQAIYWIGQNPSNGGVGFLKSLYGRLDDAELKERVIAAVGQSPDPSSQGWLMERATDGTEPIDLRKNALFWAGQRGGLSASVLRDLYDGLDDAEMKEQVIFVASQKSTPETVDFLMAVARDEQDPEIRKQAIFWLGQSKDPRVAAFLLTLIKG